MIAIKLIPSTEKCRMTDKIESKADLTAISMLKNERLSFQLCYTETDSSLQTQEFGLRVESPIRDRISIYRVEQVHDKQGIPAGDGFVIYPAPDGTAYPKSRKSLISLREKVNRAIAEAL